ncbi:uncharacterized protein LOC142980998 [Anticarsia gemmatalis]|uniref:uncharacterized protein LOC142980998 n=1 Tax=Anticarsia gemmatalis TaxID=129554 RepID=UPI003F772117
MESNMCVKFVLFLALVACIHARVLKSHDFSFPEGVSVNKREVLPPIGTVNLGAGEGAATPKTPDIVNRVAISVGTCPKGYSRMGGFCFPDDY